LAVATLWLLAVAVSAAEPLPATKSEVAAILDHLGSSQCRFFRNGSWHSGAEARDHLRMKYEYLVEQGLVATTEDFIAGAGSKSSASGDLYDVQSPDRDAEPSAVWLANELRRIRESRGKSLPDSAAARKAAQQLLAEYSASQPIHCLAFLRSVGRAFFAGLGCFSGGGLNASLIPTTFPASEPSYPGSALITLRISSDRSNSTTPRVAGTRSAAAPQAKK